MSVILPLVKKVIAEAGNGNTKLCCVIESTKNSDHWVQITWDMVNLGYPYSTHPLEKLAELGIRKIADAELAGWEPNKFMTFEHGGSNAEVTARFVEDYVHNLFDIADIEKEMTFEEQEL